MRLDLVVGPNGAGKTTFTRKILLPALPPGTAFVNADEIASTRWPEDAEARSYDAAQVAAATRVALIASRRPFVAETVFSHPSKLDLVNHARSEGFTVALHVLLVPEDLTVERVRRRVAAGGHSVPEQKIRERYHRLWPGPPHRGAADLGGGDRPHRLAVVDARSTHPPLAPDAESALIDTRCAESASYARQLAPTRQERLLTPRWAGAVHGSSGQGCRG